MDEIAKSIGWLVIIVGCVYAVGKFLESLESDRRAKREAIDVVDTHEKRLALRHFYRSTNDSDIHQEVKNNDGGWSLLMLEIDDNQYAQEMRKLQSAGAFEEALKRVQRHGYCFVLDGKRLRWKTEVEREQAAKARA